MKLPNGFGSVYKLSGNRRNPYVAKKTKGWEIDPITGKSKQLYITVGYYPTRKEALTALAEYNKDPFDLHHATITFDLEKKDIHLDERWFYVKESKTEAGIREVPIAEKIVPFFEYWMNRKCDHLICTPDDEPFQYRNYYDSYWIPLMLEFGFGKFVIDETKREPVYDGHRPHDTRHTCISLLTEKEVDERFIKKIVGHKGQGVTENVYTHIELPTKLEAINLI